jgi:hypothetical protein
MDIDNLYFELSDAGNSVRLEPKVLLHPGAKEKWDKNWIKTQVLVKGGRFAGNFDAAFMTIDFEKFKQELNALFNNLKGTAIFSGLEDQLKMKICGDGLGHFIVDVIACDQPGVGAELTFSMGFDQTIIRELVEQLTRITKCFPIVGDFNIKNE